MSRKDGTYKRRDVADTQRQLERDTDLERDAIRQDRTARRVTCYNRACPDYGRERNYDEACGCKRTSVAPKAEF